MRVIHIARAPLSEGSVAQNVLKHGTGALHIDACRIPTGSPIQGGGNNFDAWRRGEGRTDRPSMHNTRVSCHNNGRWPSNLVLSHLPGCRFEGSRSIKTNDIPHSKNVKGTDGLGGQNVYLGYAALPDKQYGYANEDGTEVIEQWDCQPGCPVDALNQDVGVRKSWALREEKQRCGFEIHGVLRESAGGGKGRGRFVNESMVSRYFKRIQVSQEEHDMSNVPKELLDYLYTMITPTHVGGESLVALDLNSVDWSSIEDNQYSGIIAQGPIPDGVLDEIWRILKPGAHVLMIAPEDEPTGHTGACALEDRGFEIRDAILWASEAGGLHYVPKASSRERNAGCGHLAEKRSKEPIYDLHEGLSEETLDTIRETLLSAGVTEEEVDALDEIGCSKDKIPESLRRKYFRRRDSDSKRYGNNHPCLHPHALVLTHKGYRSIEKIQVGDKVLSIDGNLHEVEHVSEHPYTSPHLFEIRVEDVDFTVWASDNHPFLVGTPSMRSDGTVSVDLRWEKAEDLKVGMFLASPSYGTATLKSDLVGKGDEDIPTGKYRISEITEINRIPYMGDVMNLTVEGSPTFQTVVGMSHNTVKPKDVLIRLLRDVPEGTTILDPFMGSGSMGLACLETGHDYIGIEREEEYLEIADARIRHWNANSGNLDNVATIESDAKKPDIEEPKEMSLDDLFGF